MLKKEEFETLQNGRSWPKIWAGDSVAITHLDYITSKEPVVMKGLVIAMVNRASDTAITMLQVEFGTPIVRRIVLYSPLVKDVKILQRAFIHDGKKRVRRSKLYYMIDRDPSEFTVN